MKIWLNEQYAIEKTDGNNLFGKGNDNFDFIEVYIPTAVYEQDNVIPVFIFERADKKKYGEFAHNVGTWQQDGYTVFKHVLNGFVLAQKGNLDITIKLNFLKYVDEKRFIEKTKNVYVQGVVLNAIVVENEAFILSDDPEAFLTSLKYLLNDLNARIESGDITAERALADVNGNVITDTYATKAESEQVLADAKAYGDAVFETKGNVLSKVNTLKTEIQNGTVVANNAVEATSYRDDENNLVVIKDKIEDILYLIDDVTGADLTGLQSKINALQTAWNNFMNGSESDDVIDTLNEIRNELASLDSASKKALYNLGANDSIVDNGNGTVTISRNNGAYNETVAKGVPLITLDQQGSQWLKDEWLKGLNLGDLADREDRYWVSKQTDISNFINSLPNGTYTISADLTPISLDDGYSISDLFAIYSILGGQYTSEQQSAYLNFDSLNQTKRLSMSFIKQNYTDYNFYIWGIGNHSGGNHGTLSVSNIMLVKGTKPYSHSPYNANKHITNYEAELLKKEYLRGENLIDYITFVNGTTASDGTPTGVGDYSRVVSEDFATVKPNTTYTLNTNNGFEIYEVNYFDSNKNTIALNTIQKTSYTFTTPSNCYYLTLLFRYSDNSAISPSVIKNNATFTNDATYEGEIVRSKEFEEQVEMLQTVIDALQTANNNLALRVSKLEGSVEFTGEQFVSGRAGTLADTTGYYPAGTNSFTIDGNVKSVSITYPERNSVSFSGSTITYTLRGEIAGKITNATITYTYTASTSTASEE